MAVNYGTGNGSITDAKKLSAGGINDVNVVKIDETNLDTNLVAALGTTFEKRLKQISGDIINILNNFQTISKSMKAIDDEVKGDTKIPPKASASRFSLPR